MVACGRDGKSCFFATVKFDPHSGGDFTRTTGADSESASEGSGQRAGRW